MKLATTMNLKFCLFMK